MNDILSEVPDASGSRFNVRTRFVLGLVLLAGLFGAAMVMRRRRIQIVDTTAPDAFGSAVVRE
jgi:hypothetical protein